MVRSEFNLENVSISCLPEYANISISMLMSAVCKKGEPWVGFI